MATLTIEGRSVQVDDSFLQMSPDQQNAAVEEIASSFGGQPAEVPSNVAGGTSAEAAREVAAQRLIGGVRRASAMPDQEIGRIVAGADKAARMIANGATFGLADKAAGGMDYLTGQAPSYDEGVKAQRAQTEAIRKDSPVLAGAGEALGGMATGAGLMRSGITLAGRVGPSLVGRVFGYGAEGAAYGGVHGAGNTYSDKASDYVDNAKKGAGIGSIIGAGLPAAGSAASGAYRLGSAFLGPPVEGMSRGASALMRAAAQADEAGLRALPQRGPDAMLADAGPSMLGMGQGAVTGTGEGRTRLVNALTTRDRATGDRLARTLDDNLGPSPTPSRVEAGLSGDRAYVGQEYEPIIDAAGRVDTTALANRLDAITANLRGPEQRAVQNVRQMLEIPGAPGNLDPHPRALLSTRQAIDGIMETEANPQVIRQLTLARQEVDAELARAAPGIKAVDAQIEELSRQSGGLKRGSQVFDSGKTATRPDELAAELTQGTVPKGQNVGPSAEPMRVRQGARAELDRVVGTQVNDLGALERTLATPNDWNYQKLGTVFGEGPRDRVAQALMDNRQFRDTYQKIVQNSQTAQRQGSARAMEGAAGGNVPSDITLTGIGLKAVNLVAKALSGASSANTKDEIGRVLASQGPEVGRIAQALLASAQQAATNSRTLARIIAAPELVPAAATAADRR